VEDLSQGREEQADNTKLSYTRFLDLTDDDLNDFVLDNGNINTRKKN
jgi:succinate dehydrogenase flavin-adding protein (antitoxin of CptAB toxin-antitoxin module)